MSRLKNCPFCKGVLDKSAHTCKHCSRPLPEDDYDQFSELDYEPAKKSGCLLPALVIIFTITLMAVIIVVLGMRNDAEFDHNDLEQEEESAEEVTPPITEEEPLDLPEREAVDEDEADEEALESEEPLPPDYSRVEDAFEKWLEYRLNDPAVILLPSEELDDVEQFFARYNLEEDNILVYEIEARDDQYVTALFGLPYSEWALKAVFIWRDNDWDFLREETIP